jgi:hypothetical protein
MLLNSLPTSSTYKNLVTTLTWGKETLELENVIGALFAFYQRKKNIDENSQEEWLVIKGNYECGRSSNNGDLKGKNSWSKSRRRKDINCYKCGKKWHIKRDYPDRKKNKDDKNEGSSKLISSFCIHHPLLHQKNFNVCSCPTGSKKKQFVEITKLPLDSPNQKLYQQLSYKVTR